MVRTLLGALAACLLLAPSASASITLTYANETIGITGIGNNATFLSFDSDGTVTVRNSTGVTNNSACVPEDVPTLGTYFHCPGATETVAATYGAGNDSLVFEDLCLGTITAALGDGVNAFQRPDCFEGQTATVTGGSGEDDFDGGLGPDTFTGNGGADDLRGAGGPDVLRGGPANDVLTGGDGDDQLTGDDGDDRLRGGGGNDAEDGGGGNDLLGDADSDPGSDDLRGGPGSDKLDLDAHANGAAVSLDDAANDGNPGEGDNVHSDVESVYGTRGADTIVGTPAGDVLDGGFGDDVVRGGGGDDTLTGSSDTDQLFGDAGNDTLYGGDGNDRVEGGAGTDNLFGDYSSCSAFGCSGGNDQILARDGEADAVNCGAGADTAQADAVDTIAQDGFQSCETVDRAAAPGPVVPPNPGPGPAPVVTPAPALQGASATGGKKRLSVVLTLRRASTVTVTVTRVGARKALGRVTIKAKAGKTTRVLRKVGKKALKAGRYRVTVKVGTTSRTFTVRVR